jgi:glycosyltransferase involved in cell wall biosynthesis
VVVPSHGRPAFLPDALASVLAQGVADLEVVVVDDASPEPVALPPPFDEDPRVRLVRRATNGGPGAARNTGVGAARGRYLAFLDDDDWWEPGWLADAAERLALAPVVVGWSRYHDEQGRPGRLLEGMVGDVILDGITPHLGATALRREAWVPFDERYRGSEDVAWWLAVARRWPLVTVARHVNVVRRHAGARTGHGAAARAAGSRRLLTEEAAYFAAHPRAAAFRWRRTGLQELAAGNRAAARRAFARSLRLRPGAGTAKDLARSLLPRRRVSPPTGGPR